MLRITKIYQLLTIVAVIIFVAQASIVAGTYRIDGSVETDSVLFESTAKLEFIQGKTNSIRGYFTFDPENRKDSISGTLMVDLATLKTGIETRDEHMRDDYLETDKFPHAYFKLKSINDMPDEIIPDKQYTVKSEGDFYIHNVYRSIKPDIKFTVLNDGQMVQIETSFYIDLEDYDIERPKLVFMKLAKTIKVQLFFTGLLADVTEKIVLPDSFQAK